MGTMKENIKKAIGLGNFLEAKKMLHLIDRKKLEDVLFLLGMDDENFCAYTFVVFLQLEHETIENHLLAFNLLVNAFAYLNGSYATSLYHIKRAIELDPKDIELVEMLLFVHSFPLKEKLISDDEARHIANMVLLKKPASISALSVLYGFEEALNRTEKTNKDLE